MFNLFTSDQPLTSTNVNAAGEVTNDIGCIFYVFDIRYRKSLESGQRLKVEFKF